MSEFPQRQYPQGTPPPAPKKHHRWPWIAGSAVGVIGIGVGVAALLGAFTAATPEQSYLQAVRIDTGVAAIPDADLLDLGQSSCSAVAGDGDPQAWYERTKSMQLTDSDRGAIQNSAIRAFCPQYSFALDDPILTGG